MCGENVGIVYVFVGPRCSWTERNGLGKGTQSVRVRYAMLMLFKLIM